MNFHAKSDGQLKLEQPTLSILYFEFFFFVDLRTVSSNRDA